MRDLVDVLLGELLPVLVRVPVTDAVPEPVLVRVGETVGLCVGEVVDVHDAVFDLLGVRVVVGVCVGLLPVVDEGVPV